MLKDLNLLDDGEVVIVGSHAEHEPMLHVEGDFANIAELADERMEGVCVWYPANEPCRHNNHTDVNTTQEAGTHINAGGCMLLTHSSPNCATR